MTALEFFIALLRGVHVAALISLFGTLLFGATLEALPALRRLACISAAFALLSGIAWLVSESAVIANADGLAATLRALPIVGLQTQYGRWFVARCILLLIILVLPLGRYPALIASGAALAIQPMLGHAGAIGDAALLASETLHLLAAGAWLGGLLPLFIAVATLPPARAITLCHSFTPIGLSSVLLLGGTAILKVTELVGGMPGLFGTAYGHVALIKLALFLVLLLLAMLNRLVLTERLAHSTSAMLASIALEMLIGTAVIIAAGFLASLTPGTHQQPVWPFPWRPSKVAFLDPDLRDELIGAFAALALAVCIAIAAVIWRRVRWVAIVAAIGIAALTIPHFDLLFVEAFPTSFFTSPTEFAATAIAHGSMLFAANCTTCHGADARGDGPAAKSLPVPPADLTAEHLWAHGDGEIYWYIAHGFAAPDGTITMPGFGSRLSSEAIWDLIDFVRAHNAGIAMQTTGIWPHPLLVPQFDTQCPGNTERDLDDMRGTPIRIIAAAGDEQTQPPSLPDATTVFLVRKPAKPSSAACVASEPQTWTAFAILLGVPLDAMAGWQILADSNAWLRAAWHPGVAGNWDDPSIVGARLRGIEANPIASDTAEGHVHRH